MTETPETTLERLNDVVDRLERLLPQVTEALQQRINTGGPKHA